MGMRDATIGERAAPAGGPDSGGPGSGEPGSGAPDSGEPGSGAPDKGASDSVTRDSGTRDSGTRDSGALRQEPADKARLLARLRRIEGQVRGLHRMVDAERYCPEILTQVAAVQASLRSAAELLLHDHLRHCVTGALRSGEPAEAEATYRELTDLFKKYGR